MSCGVGRRCGSDLALLWLWGRLAAAALIHLLACKLPYATGMAIKKKIMGVPVVAQWLTNPTRNREVAGSVPALAQWVNDPARRCRELWCGLQMRLGSCVAVALA